MEQYPRVIEFYGLPGVGKSTVCDRLIGNDKRYVKIKDVMVQYNNEHFIFKITHLPIKRWLKFTSFLLSLSGRNKNSIDEYLTFYYQVLAYSYCCTKMQGVTLVMDHGLVQQLGSILHNMDFAISYNSLHKFSKFLHSMRPLHIIYSRLSEEDALKRMRERKRDSGRIDAVMNDTEKALYLLQKESRNIKLKTERKKTDPHILHAFLLLLT